MKIYCDACAVNRLSDNQSQARIRSEAEAVEELLRFVLVGNVEWICSRALEAELAKNPDQLRRSDSLALLSQATSQIDTDDSIRSRARVLASLGYGAFDALHLAHAEAAKVDALVTTDDRFLRKAASGIGSPLVRLINPIDCLQEVKRWP